ncbi:hypothetical protein Y1Q_0020029 [Alligator mississippiensis]|uniref:Uncharacterized protein n=1 Tax=Alligator mississippiensis TaxID=8496 RepID=A0A151LYT7_ALLMI|nr:hypothetical protein Y1Q_0020029 [Alligator mississippiensis]
MGMEKIVEWWIVAWTVRPNEGKTKSLFQACHCDAMSLYSTFDGDITQNASTSGKVLLYSSNCLQYCSLTDVQVLYSAYSLIHDQNEAF